MSVRRQCAGLVIANFYMLVTTVLKINGHAVIEASPASINAASERRQADICWDPPVLGPQYDTSDCDPGPQGATCQVACSEGYVGNVVLWTCRPGFTNNPAQWLGTIPICQPSAVRCQPYSADWSVMYQPIGCGSLPEGSTCTLACAGGYRGSPTKLTCNGQIWEGTPPDCNKVLVCRAIGDYLGPKFDASACGTSGINKTCAVTCASPYTGSASTYTCYDNGQGYAQWYGKRPSCKSTVTTTSSAAASNPSGVDPSELPVDGVWQPWNEWSECTVSCNGGSQRRSRRCKGPFNGGASCAGGAMQSRPCRLDPCLDMTVAAVVATSDAGDAVSLPSTSTSASSTTSTGPTVFDTPLDTPEVHISGPVNADINDDRPAMRNDAACACAGAIVKSSCYDTLSKAVKAARSGDTVYIGRAKTVNSPIQFYARTITLQGVECDGQKASVTAFMSEREGAILMASARRHSITLADIDFMRDPSSGWSAALRAASDSTTIALDVSGCTFRNFKTKAASGSVIYIPTVDKVRIAENCIFDGNTVDNKQDASRPGSWEWGGGGALYLGNVYQRSTVAIGGTWRNNQILHQHGLSGCIHIEWIEGVVNIDGTFINNMAADGGAIHAVMVTKTGVLNIDGFFEENYAKDWGIGCRGGAVRPQFIAGTVYIRGTYRNNKSDRRGGVIASNRLYNTGRCIISGTFINNEAVNGGGGVFSITNEAYGLLTFQEGSTFRGNKAKFKSSTVAQVQPGHWMLSEVEWAKEGEKTISYRAPPGTAVADNPDD